MYMKLTLWLRPAALPEVLPAGSWYLAAVFWLSGAPGARQMFPGHIL